VQNFKEVEDKLSDQISFEVEVASNENPWRPMLIVLLGEEGEREESLPDHRGEVQHAQE